MTNRIYVKLIFVALCIACAWAQCPCTPSSLCDRIQKVNDREIVAFQISNSFWKYYDWNELTSVVICTGQAIDMDELCWAHLHGVRMLFVAFYPKEFLSNTTYQQNWIQEQVFRVQSNYMDGINLDFEEPLVAGSSLVLELTYLVNRTRNTFSSALPGSQISVDVPWSPQCIDGRCFDFTSLSLVSDFLFIMGYDIQSQIWDLNKCVAAANSPLSSLESGINLYINNHSISPRNLVLGLPWYGYCFACQSINPVNHRCNISQVAYHGAPCSAVTGGNQHTLKTMLGELQTSLTGRMFDSATSTYWFETLKPADAEIPYIVHNPTLQSTTSHYQCWYDSIETLKPKYNLEKVWGLRGLGMWQADALPYTEYPDVAASMWTTLTGANQPDVPDDSPTDLRLLGLLALVIPLAAIIFYMRRRPYQSNQSNHVLRAQKVHMRAQPRKVFVRDNVTPIVTGSEIARPRAWTGLVPTDSITHIITTPITPHPSTDSITQITTTPITPHPSADSIPHITTTPITRIPTLALLDKSAAALEYSKQSRNEPKKTVKVPTVAKTKNVYVPPSLRKGMETQQIFKNTNNPAAQGTTPSSVHVPIQSVGRTVKNTVGNVGKDGMKNTVKNVGKDGMKNTVGNVEKDGMKNTVKNVGKDGMKNTVGNVGKDGMKNTVGNVGKDGMKNAVGNVGKDGMKNTVGRTVKNTVKNVGKDGMKNTVGNTLENAAIITAENGVLMKPKSIVTSSSSSSSSSYSSSGSYSSSSSYSSYSSECDGS